MRAEKAANSDRVVVSYGAIEIQRKAVTRVSLRVILKVSSELRYDFRGMKCTVSQGVGYEGFYYIVKCVKISIGISMESATILLISDQCAGECYVARTKQAVKSGRQKQHIGIVLSKAI